MKQRAIIYAAKSTDDLHGSIPTQIADCERMTTREGWMIAGTYSDVAASAYHGNRGNGLVQAREHAEQLATEHGECALIVQHTDRLARGDGIAAQHLVEVLLWARKAGVRIRSVQDDSTGENLLLAAVMGERNHEDSKRKAAACAAGKRRSAERGEPNGVVPDGYTVEREMDGPQVVRHIVLDPEREPVYRLIWDLFLGGATVSAIVGELDAHGYQTAPRRKVHRPKPFDSTRVRRLLTNPFYAGLVISRGEIVGSGNWPAYIEPDDWHRFSHERSSGKRYKPRDVGRPPGGMLSKVARCAECGTSVVHLKSSRTRVDGTRSRWYVCIDRRHRPANGCKARPFNAEQVERMVLENLDRLLGEQKAWADALIASHKQEIARLDTEVKRAQDEISECESAIDQLVERYDAATLSGDEAEIDLARRSMASRQKVAKRAKIRLQAATDALSQVEPDEDTGKLVFARLWESLNGSMKAADGDVKGLRDALIEHFDHFDLRHDFDGSVQIFPFLSVEAITLAQRDRSILQAHAVIDARKSAASKCGAWR